VDALHRRSRHAATLAWASGVIAALSLTACAATPPPKPASRLVVRSPKLPLTETAPAPSSPTDLVKAGVLARINADRAKEGLRPVAWDAGASKVADAFTRAQVSEGTRGHFLMDGLPPYARTSFAGVFGMGAENSVAWITTAPAFEENELALALSGHEDMMRETPPNDGHRRAILDPDATHVGVGYSMRGGSFRMAEEFQTRRLASLSLDADGGTLIVRGRTPAGYMLQFVAIAFEPEPAPLSKEETRARRNYVYPETSVALVKEGRTSMRIIGADTDDRIQLDSTGEFFFRYAPPRPGLWTMTFYVSEGREKPRPGGLAVFWIAAAEARAPR
jgi:uncharacterized protein YkwD